MAASNPVRHLRQQRFAVLAGIVLGGFGVIAIGLLRLQVAQHERYRELSKENHVRLEVLRAPRGAIFDRNGVLLADSAPSFNIVFRPFPAESLHRARMVESHEWIATIASLLGSDSAVVRRQVREANATGKSAVLQRNAPFAVRAAVEESRDLLPGVDVQIEPLRRYAFGTAAAHLLGYAGEVSDAELDSLGAQGYRSGDLIGRSGVERSYEEILRGQDGAEFVVVNASGRRVSTLTEGPPRLPIAGHDLVLTLDLEVQQAMEEAMKDVARGAAVAIDPRDGGILGMVSRPAFDPNEFSVGLSRDRWRQLSSGGSNPLLNRAIQGVYPPGSTFKIVSMVAALRTNVAQAATRLGACPGYYYFGGRRFGCWKHEGHGSLDFIGAIQHSCDVYFYQIGTRLGLSRLEEAARDFGLGDRTGIDLPQEKRGLMPNQAWYDRRFGAGRTPKGVMLNLAIGQGEVLVTPLQLALMLAETAASGRAMRPHVVREVRGISERVLEPTHATLQAEPAVWAAVHQGLELVVTAGTAAAARVPGLRVAGKTGTAQNPHGDDHALFACYAPVEDPRLVLAFVIENSGHGGSVAAPMAGHVLRRVFLPDSLQKKVAPPPVPRDSLEAAHGD